MSSILDTREHRRRIYLLLGIALVSVGLWQTWIGSLALYPFSILATWFHEMGHGLMAILTGASFERLVIFADGSGYAQMLSGGGRLSSAIIAAAGPLGPGIAGGLLIAASRSEKSSRLALEILGWAIILSTLIWVRSLAGWVVLPAVGFTILAVDRFGSPSQHRLAVQILGVQAGISVWRQFDYLFSPGGIVGGRIARSDTGAISDALLLPYWMWGALLSVATVALMWWGLRTAFRRV